MQRYKFSDWMVRHFFINDLNPLSVIALHELRLSSKRLGHRSAILSPTLRLSRSHIARYPRGWGREWAVSEYEFGKQRGWCFCLKAGYPLTKPNRGVRFVFVSSRKLGEVTATLLILFVLPDNFKLLQDFLEIDKTSLSTIWLHWKRWTVRWFFSPNLHHVIYRMQSNESQVAERALR